MRLWEQWWWWRFIIKKKTFESRAIRFFIPINLFLFQLLSIYLSELQIAVWLWACNLIIDIVVEYVWLRLVIIHARLCLHEFGGRFRAVLLVIVNSGRMWIKEIIGIYHFLLNVQIITCPYLQIQLRPYHTHRSTSTPSHWQWPNRPTWVLIGISFQDTLIGVRTPQTKACKVHKT